MQIRQLERTRANVASAIRAEGGQTGKEQVVVG
jgi:hypothetical protein